MTGRYFPPEADLASWIIGQGLAGSDISAFLGQLAERMLAVGIPVTRTYVGLPMISPTFHAMNYVWHRRDGVGRSGVRHEDHPGTFQASPFWTMMEAGEVFRRFRLADGPTGYGLLDRLRAEGATDHVCYLVSFDETKATALIGTAISFTTETPEGFSAFDLDRLTRVAPLLGLAACRFALTSAVTEVVDAYVGHDAGRRVLKGEIRRGEGHRRRAALLVADLAGFTSVADRSSEGLIARLGLHLAAMVEPVEEAGGEVLKFLGDGILAGWPADEDETPTIACRAALGAAEEALRRNAALAGSGELGLKVALHLGEVFYGNIGAGSRLDFTVIGPAVNETCRIETLCGQLGRPLLMSAPFAAACGRPATSLGRHELRHVREPREIFAPAAA